MQDGEKDTKRLIKKKFDLPNARNRDPTQPLPHTYKAKVGGPVTTSQKWKDAGGNTLKAGTGLGSKLPQTPILVQYQNALLREQKNVSPFLQVGPPLDPKQLTIEPPPQPRQKHAQVLGVSQSVK